MIFFLLCFFISSGETRRENYYQWKMCAKQHEQYFKIKKLEVAQPMDTKGVLIQIHLIAELNHKVQDPHLEIQLVKDRIPYLRYLDSLCKPGVLICPASFSQMVFGKQFPIPSTTPTGDYNMRFIFREKDQRISCYEIPYEVKYIDIEQKHLNDSIAARENAKEKLEQLFKKRSNEKIKGKKPKR